METETVERKVISFKEVHIDLEKESVFLKKSHDIEGYKNKAEFLNGSGFQNSIAAKLYSSISENSHKIDEYEKKYHGQYRFILKPQLERLCEKYNLFVREPKHFLGDIPEPNIKEMINFKVHLEDLNAPKGTIEDVLRENSRALEASWDKIFGSEDNGLHRGQCEDFVKTWMEANRENIINPNLSFDSFSMSPEPILKGCKSTMNNLNKLGFRGVIQIAAVEELFDQEAFTESKARVLGRAELTAKFQVDLDPIVLCETRHGYIVITAWGDEANDELILNANKN
jgi:hypothetical protein